MRRYSLQSGFWMGVLTVLMFAGQISAQVARAIPATTARLACACFFALICLTSVSHAHAPPRQPADSVHVSLPFDYEQWHRDHPRPAAKRLANLNVGEPRTVRMIYFLPNDRPFRQEVVDSMKAVIRQVQTFYAEQMQAHGYGDMTFRFETDAQGEPVVHRVDGQNTENHYSGAAEYPVFAEIDHTFDRGANIYFIVLDTRFWRAVGKRMRKSGGDAFITVSGLSPSAGDTEAHELGHAFGLLHDFRDDSYTMSYGAGGRISASAAEFLSVHPYFNSNIPIEEAQAPAIELISSRTYPAGSKSFPVRLKLDDSEGLKQVCLFVTALGNIGSEVWDCRGLEGEKNAVVEFEYDGVIPSTTWPGGSPTSLSNPVVHTILVGAVDSNGNARGYTDDQADNVRGAAYGLAEDSPYRIATFDSGGITYVDGLSSGAYASVSFSPDGDTLAFGSKDQSVKLWDVKTRTEVATLAGTTSQFHSVSFSPDGATLATAEGRTVKLWDVKTRTEVATLAGTTSQFHSVSFSPDGATLATAGGWPRLASIIRLWDVPTRENIANFGNTSGVESVSFSPDGTTLASGSADGAILLWAVEQQLSPPIPNSDFDGDGTVGIGDFLLFAGYFGLSQGDAGYDARYDLDGDGTIGIGDFLIFVEDFGT